MDLRTKYDTLSASWSTSAYGRPDLVYARRAELVRSLGPVLEPGARVLELGCADGALAQELARAGLAVEGVDQSEGMVLTARERVAGATFRQGDFLTYVPTHPVTATVGFRIMPYVDDIDGFFRHVAGYTERKVLVDFMPRHISVRRVSAALARAGFPELAVSPWLLPARTKVGARALSVLSAVERRRALALPVARLRGTVVVAAWRDDRALYEGGGVVQG